MNVGSGFSDAARGAERMVASMGGLDVRGESMAGESTDLAGLVAEDLADVEDLAVVAARVLNAASGAAGGSGCSKPAISSW
jgi:hypothetical protein